MKTLDIIGCGNVGRTLARLWAEAGAISVQDILNRSVASAQRAAAFVGAGRAVAAYAELRPADVYLIGATDDAIPGCGEALAAAAPPPRGSVVFHASGALPATVLGPVAAGGARVASVHPLKTFPSPARAAATFSGTWCGGEGDAAALDTLRPLFAAIGATVVEIDPRHKVLYHAAAVVACNYLTALLAAGAELLAASGVRPEAALRLLEPLVRETVDNAFTAGPAGALTGPIARGDLALVRRQQEAVARIDPVLGELYRVLGQRTVALARARGSADPAGLEALEALLASRST